MPSRLRIPLLLTLTLAGPGPAVASDATLRLVWSSTTGQGVPGSSDIVAEPGDQLTGTLYLTVDADGASSFSVSLRFDPDLGNELDLVSVVDLLPGGLDFPVVAGVTSTESTALVGGEVSGFDAATLDGGPTGASLAIAELVFEVTAQVADDGPDVTTGFYHPSDGMFDNSVPYGAAVNVSSGLAGVYASGECGNGIDDDGDGATDLDDPGCLASRDAFETSDYLGCDDGADNDGDGLVDAAQDPECQGPGDPAEGGLELVLQAHQGSYTSGETMTVARDAVNTGVPATADFFACGIQPDGDTVTCFLDSVPTFALGSLSNLPSLQPIAAGVNLVAPFSAEDPAWFEYTWTGTETPGVYTIFALAVRPGALANGALDPGEAIAITFTSFTFTP